MKSIRLVRLKMVREKSLPYQESVNSAETAISIVRSLFAGSYIEIVAVVGLDNAHHPTVVHIVNTGSPTQSMVAIGNVLKPLLLSNSTQYILIHNHPGSSLVPSSADRQITDKLKGISKEMEIELLDHIILDGEAEKHYSFKANGLL